MVFPKQNTWEEIRELSSNFFKISFKLTVQVEASGLYNYKL